jgi:hypothetical protein
LRTGRGLRHDRAVPIDLDRDRSRGWLVARVTGVLTIEELIGFLKTARADLDTRANPLLVDATAATTSMTATDVDTAVQVVKSVVAAQGMRAHVAVFTTDDALYRWLLAYEVACTAIGVRVIRVFRQRVDAEQWLAILSTAGRFHA